MDPQLIFEAMPFEISPEFHGEFQASEAASGSFLGEEEFSRRFLSRPPGIVPRAPRGTALRTRMPSIPGRRRPTKPPARLPRPRLGSPWGIVREPYGVVSEPYPAEPEPREGSDHIRWVQNCLNQLLGLQLPLSGVMAVATRSAVRNFQRQQGLPVSGMVSPETQEALQAACAGSQDARAPEEELSSSWESLSSDGEMEQEFVVQSSCTITYQKISTDLDAVLPHPKKVIIANPKLPGRSGVYVIKIAQQPYYVGVAIKRGGVRQRFNDRVKEVRDFRIAHSVIADRKVDVYELVGGSCTMNRRKEGSTAPGSPVKSGAALQLLEQYLIRKFNTHQARQGNNSDVERVLYNPGIWVIFKGSLGDEPVPESFWKK